MRRVSHHTAATTIGKTAIRPARKSARGVVMSGKYTKVENPSEEILTYITTAKDMIYVYAVVDLCGKIVLFYHIGNNMMISLITYSIWEASQKETAANGLNLHSDQRSQYTLQE